ncbi:MAG: hypothetical protein Q8K04_06685 [Lutibacter sp.]|nr:hypothetical protein [Lutibacter sp.]MDP3945633.1 hypothetical protein [Lutibacter sp.]
MNRKKVKILILCFSFILIGTMAYAKKKGPPTPELANTPPPPPGTPIDGGLSLLLASGVAYGIYALKRKKE